MKKQWQICRAVAECPDGQRHWDYAYQFLLRWMMEQSIEQPTSQENDHEDCLVCPSIDQPANAESKH
jgi:hypothetical protein